MTEYQSVDQQFVVKDDKRGPIDHVLPNGERVMSQREFGRLIHAILGLDEPTPTMEELQSMGYKYKEISFAAKTIALQTAIEQLGADIGEHDFIPSQGQEWNAQFMLPYRYLEKGDLQAAITEHGMNPLTSYIQHLFIHYADVAIPTFQQTNPRLFQLMARIEHKKPEDFLKKQNLIDGLEGVKVATRFIRALMKKVPRDQLGATLERSMPVLYTLASQNLEGKGSPYVAEMLTTPEILEAEKETRLRTGLYEYLKTLTADEQTEIINYLLEHMMYSGLDNEDKDSPEIMNALADLERQMHADPDLALKYASGIALPFSNALPASFHDQINDRCTYYFGKLNIAVNDEEHPLPDDIKRAVNDLVELYWEPFFNEDILSIVTKDGIPRAVLKSESEDNREPAIFGLDDVIYNNNKLEIVPVRDIVPEDRTVGCVGMHTRIKPEQLQRIMDRTNFHPKEINALTLTALIALDAIDGIEVGPSLN